MVCTVRGAIDADGRPNWNERVPATLFALQVGPAGDREQELLKQHPNYVLPAMEACVELRK